MRSESFDSHGVVVYIVGGEVSCCLKVVGSNFFVWVFTSTVRKVVPIVLSEIYLFDSESGVMC
jgi:hypothetical protein